MCSTTHVLLALLPEDFFNVINSNSLSCIRAPSADSTKVVRVITQQDCCITLQEVSNFMFYWAATVPVFNYCNIPAALRLGQDLQAPVAPSATLEVLNNCTPSLTLYIQRSLGVSSVGKSADFQDVTLHTPLSWPRRALAESKRVRFVNQGAEVPLRH